MKTTPDFIIIDDDSLNNMVGKMVIQVTFPGRNINAFTDPGEGLEYLRALCQQPGAKEAVVFLDINMPRLSGWDVLDALAIFPDVVRECFKIFMLSSSIDYADIKKVNEHPLVTAYVEKPLTQNKLRSLLIT